MSQTTPQTSTSPPQAPSPAVPANGAVNPQSIPAAAAATVATAADKALLKRMKQIESLGEDIRQKKSQIAKQQTVAATAKSQLDTEREYLHRLERERDEMQEDLDLLAVGKATERLPFPKPTEATKGKATPLVAVDAQTAADALQTRFDALTLADLGVKGAVAEKLAADGVKTGKDLRVWINGFPRRAIKGIGDGAIEKLTDVMASTMLGFQQQAKEAAKVDVSVDAAGKSAPEFVSKAQKDAAEPAKTDSSFDDAAFDPKANETIVETPILKIILGRRKNGRYASGGWCKVGGAVMPTAVIEGDYADRLAAITAAEDAIDQFVKSCRNATKLSAKSRSDATEIRKALDAIDKKLVSDAKGAA